MNLEETFFATDSVNHFLSACGAGCSTCATLGTCQTCLAGYEASGTGCAPCNAGTYSANAGDTCSSCGTGEYPDSTQTSCASKLLIIL